MNDNSSCTALQIEDIKQTQRLKQMEEEDQQKRISNTRRTIEDLKAELAKVGDQPDVSPRINAVNVELRRIQVDRAKIEGEKSDLRREKDNILAESKSEFPSLHKQRCNYDAAHMEFNSAASVSESKSENTECGWCVVYVF